MQRSVGTRHDLVIDSSVELSQRVQILRAI
jgi:hypothetical protein